MEGSTVFDDQEAVYIKVLEGEAELAKDNIIVTEFELTGIQKGLAGEPLIEVTYSINQNGIFQAVATDKQTHVRKEVALKYVQGRTPDNSTISSIKEFLLTTGMD